jgi:FlaA1/EpsC-like NDP-sugar epimerase
MPSAPPVVIFGNGQVAELALARLREHRRHEVMGFVVDRPFVGEGRLHGLPVRPFDEVASHWPPGQHAMFVAVGPVRVNRLRAERCAQARALGYALVNIVSPAPRSAPMR